MSDKTRPFVDRRIGFVILFDERIEGGVNADRIKERVNQSIETTNIQTKVSHASGKDVPPQVRLVLHDSTYTPQSISILTRTIKDVLEDELGLPVMHMNVVSMALSPGDKVRNTIGI